MMLKFIQNEPVLVFNKNLVLADIHLGLEYELYKSGIKVPSQTEKMKKQIDNLIKKTKVKKMIFLGDIKHQVPGVSWQELKEIPDFFKHFSKKIETHIVLGNHDSEIPALVEDVKIHPTSALSFPEKIGISRSDDDEMSRARFHNRDTKVLRSQRKVGIQIHDTTGFRLEDAYIMHGHAWPKKDFLKCKYLITSHTHPLIEVKDKIGHKFVERVWVKASFDSKKVFAKYKSKKFPHIILMPAFNDLSGGAALNVETGRRQRKTEETFLGPITSLIDQKKTEIYLLDGTYLGKLQSLKQI